MKILDVPQSGSVAGVTSSRNRFGQYRRTRAVPVQPVSARRTYVRGVFGDLSSTWRTLTQAQQQAWAEYAAAHPRTDSLGQSVVLSGIMAFIGHNSLLLQVGLTMENNPPANDGLTATDFVWFFQATAGVITDAQLYLPPADPNGKRFISVSRQLSAGINFNKQYAYLAYLQGDDTNWTGFDMLPTLASVIGTPTENNKIFCRIRLVAAEYTAGQPQEHSQLLAPPTATASENAGTLTAVWTGAGVPEFILIRAGTAPDWVEVDRNSTGIFTGVTTGDYRVVVSVGGTLVDITAEVEVT